VLHPKGGRTPATAKHAFAVIVEDVPPVAVTVFAIVMVQSTWKPAPVGNAGGSHCVAAGATAAGIAAAALDAPANPATKKPASAVHATKSARSP
jgi:hypothetical protein